MTTGESEAQEREVCPGAGEPRRRPSELRSSSISGQCKPKPPPASFHSTFVQGLACSNRGNHTRGTLRVWQSSSSPFSLSSETSVLTSFLLHSLVYHLYSYSLHIESKSISLKSTSGKSNFSTSSSIEKDNDSGEIKDASISSTIFTCI